jgi:hypothetical protein
VCKFRAVVWIGGDLLHTRIGRPREIVNCAERFRRNG